MTLPRYPEYKDSGAEWLGKVPAHWDVRPVKHLLAMRSGGTPSKERQDYWDGDVPWASSKDLKVPFLADTEDHVTQHAITDGAASLVAAGSVLIVVRGMILAHTFPVTRAVVPMAINQDLKALTPRSALSTSFVEWLLRGAARESLRLTDEAAHGTAVLRMDRWSRMSLPLPSPPEQTSIVTFLDRETAKIDALVAEQRRLLELLKEKRQAVISHAVTRGLNPDAPMKPSGIEWLGDVPAHWEVTRLKHIASDIQMGPFGGMLLNLEDQDTGFKVFGQENTITGDLSLGRRWISAERYSDLSRYQVEAGDLLLTRKGSIGNAMLVTHLSQPGIFDSDTIRVRVSENVILHQMLALLLHDAAYVSEQIQMTKRGAILAGLNSETIANIVLVVPPPPEQLEVLRNIQTRILAFNTLTAEAQRAIDLLQERRTALISAAVTGQIDVRCIGESSAS